MRNLLRCRRGSVAFATVIALVPLIGVVALGAEAGSWYVTKQRAQNAADAAAYSGALTARVHDLWRRRCDTHNRGLSRQAICGTERVLQLGRHRLSRRQLCDQPSDRNLADRADRDRRLQCGTFTTPPAGTGNAVRATVSQQQPGYLAAVLGLTTVNIPAQAIAQVQNPSKLCALALGPDPNGGEARLKLLVTSATTEPVAR